MSTTTINLKGRYDRRIHVPLKQVEELAARGLTKDEIARELNMSHKTFWMRLASELGFYRAWEKGAKQAGTFRPKQKPKSLEAYEGVIKLQPGDQEIVLAALKTRKNRGKKYSARKRVSHLRELTGLDTGQVVKALERLVMHHYATVVEGLVFTEYEAV